MTEWWTYTLSDFLLFSPRTYYRLFEIYNAAIWPAQLATIGLGFGIVALLRRPSKSSGRVIAAILAACWLWVAIAYHLGRYASINWAAVYFAWAFGLEAALFIALGIVRGRRKYAFEFAAERPSDRSGPMGLAIFLFALAVEPFVSPLLGRGWKQAEVFGIAPDPTAVATLGILLLAAGRGRGWLMILPVAWCAVSGAMLLAMKSPDAWIPPLAAVIAIFVAVRQRRSLRRLQASPPHA